MALILFLGCPLFGDTGNYNSVLLGDRAAGMGGAFTALTDDSAACSFYNPATLALMKGTSFSASASLFNKYDTSFSDAGNLSDSSLKLNRGSFQGIPSSAGSAFGFGHFAAGISITTPEYDIYSADITLPQYANSTTFVSAKDQSLWIGGNLAVNFSDDLSLGMTFYYTSRDFQRSSTDQTVQGPNTKFSYETKSFTSNNIIYLLGGLYKITPRLWLGVSWRLPSIQISGDGSYYRSTLDTSQSNIPIIITQKSITSQSHTPQKLNAGVSYSIPQKYALDFDVSFYGADSYRDLLDPTAGDQISNRQIVNYALGGEYYLVNWLAWRAGAFTNFSSHADIIGNNNRQGDHIDMLGFSSNIAVIKGNTSVTFGGYFSGGRGQSTQSIGEQIVVTPKVQYIYAMLLASAYQF